MDETHACILIAVKSPVPTSGYKIWNNSHSYQKTRVAKANLERKLAAHRKSLHGKLVNEILRLGNLSDRIHRCDCRIICQRDLYSAFLAKFVDENELLPANQAQNAWLGVEPLLYAATRQATTQTNLRLGGQVPSSFGKFPESERVATKVQNARTKNLDVVPNREQPSRGIIAF